MSYEGLPLDITKGGTNATSASAARTNLGVGSGDSPSFSNITLQTGGALRTGTSAADTALIQAYDVDGASYTTFATLTANNTPTMDLSDSVTKSGAYIYRAGGTDIPVTDGGTGLSILTAHALYVGNGTSAPTPLAIGATGTILQGNTGANPSFSTATYPSTTTINQILYSSAANTVTGLATANSGVLTTSTTGVPSIDTTNFHVLTTGVQMKGNNTNTAPPTGFIGEQIRGFAANGSIGSFSTGTFKTITSIDLTPGVWDVYVTCRFSGGAITGTGCFCGIATVTNSTTGYVDGDNTGSIPSVPTAIADVVMVVPQWRILVSANTTYYLTAAIVFTGGTPTCGGRISGVRVG